MAELHTICSYLDTLLESNRYRDVATNGLQVESANTTLSTIVCAVDSGESVIREALSHQTDLLIVHHGLFWGGANSVTGSLARKIALLQQGGCSLYASHLPLDGHADFGNGSLLATELGLVNVQAGFEYGGGPVGVTCKTPEGKLRIEELAKLCGKFLGALTPPLVFPFGAVEISTIGIVTGSGSFAIESAHSLGLDLLITGEPKQEAYHNAKDIGQSVIFVGHYASETFGVRALTEHLCQKFKVKGHFINQETGI
jgi:dinuclear metal center YbgI/SA1388 family protein